MTSEPLAENSGEREMFLRALREYSDSCEAPQLTADCPFSKKTTEGAWICGEECLDILGRHKAPDGSDIIELSGGYQIARRRQPRHRVGAGGLVRPFDARGSGSTT